MRPGVGYNWRGLISILLNLILVRPYILEIQLPVDVLPPRGTDDYPHTSTLLKLLRYKFMQRVSRALNFAGALREIGRQTRHEATPID